ncbi:helix-turn-helix domain-containing protein [Aminobacter sp. UC22_36]|uniref:helix-turn-helix domain-containing protein n=1 Tax=Aminobacter sp. UC22_36 TaxID=3374549 RepID=UPI003757C688
MNIARTALDFIPDKDRSLIVTLSGGATHSIRSATSLSFIAESHYATVFFAPARKVRAAIDSSTMQEFDVPAGALGIVPAGSEAATVWPSRKESVSVVITPAALAALSEGEYDGKTFAPRPTMATTIDLNALHLASLLRSELTERPAANELYVDSIVTLFGIHLLRNYSQAEHQATAARGALSPRNVRRIREYLAENFTSKLLVADLAAVCELSPRHFIQAFTRSFGRQPHQYLMGLRLDFAERLLVEGKLTATEVALLSGFASQSHLTYTLKKHRGLTPVQVRQG